MDFEFPLIPLLPLPITLVPAATFVALENNQNQAQQVFASSVSIGVSRGSSFTSSNSCNSISSSYASSFTSASSLLSDQERLGAIVDALGQASAKVRHLHMTAGNLSQSFYDKPDSSCRTLSFCFPIHTGTGTPDIDHSDTSTCPEPYTACLRLTHGIGRRRGPMAGSIGDWIAIDERVDPKESLGSE